MFNNDVISVETLCARVEELIAEGKALTDILAELKALTDILAELKGNGGDVQRRGVWYPDYLYADHYFTDYVREMLIDCGTIPRDLPEWVEIDWDATAENLKVDYASIEIDGNTYWYRYN
jgi:hypothetical protein